MNEDPMDAIEFRQGQTDLGRMAVRVYTGALEEADGDHTLALRATVAYFVAVMRSGTEGQESA